MKTKKKLYFLLYFGHFLSIILTTRTFLENLFYHFLLFPGFYCCEEFQNKTTEKIKKKVSYRHTYRQMNGYPDKHEFV